MTQHEVSYKGEFVHFERIWSYPKPAQRLPPPVLVGGTGPTVLDRVLTALRRLANIAPTRASPFSWTTTTTTGTRCGGCGPTVMAGSWKPASPRATMPSRGCWRAIPSTGHDRRRALVELVGRRQPNSPVRMSRKTLAGA
jgi:hypothetical protein